MSAGMKIWIPDHEALVPLVTKVCMRGPRKGDPQSLGIAHPRLGWEPGGARRDPQSLAQSLGLTPLPPGQAVQASLSNPGCLSFLPFPSPYAMGRDKQPKCGHGCRTSS